jgi:hypothetical protein
MTSILVKSTDTRDEGSRTAVDIRIRVSGFCKCSMFSIFIESGRARVKVVRFRVRVMFRVRVRFRVLIPATNEGPVI